MDDFCGPIIRTARGHRTLPQNYEENKLDEMASVFRFSIHHLARFTCRSFGELGFSAAKASLRLQTHNQ